MLDIPAAIYDGMIEHARARLPAECCGLLAGKGGRILQRYELHNELMSPVAYRADARGLFAAFREMRERELELLAIYHSHPSSPAQPSRVDLDQNYYGDIPRIIISLASERPVVKTFRLSASGFDELPCCRNPN